MPEAEQRLQARVHTIGSGDLDRFQVPFGDATPICPEKEIQISVRSSPAHDEPRSSKILLEILHLLQLLHSFKSMNCANRTGRLLPTILP